jgi:hypothetical protein
MINVNKRLCCLLLNLYNVITIENLTAFNRKERKEAARREGKGNPLKSYWVVLKIRYKRFSRKNTGRKLLYCFFLEQSIKLLRVVYKLIVNGAGVITIAFF